MTSIIPLQNPQRRNNELTRQKVKKRFRPASATNMRLGMAPIVVDLVAMKDRFDFCQREAEDGAGHGVELAFGSRQVKGPVRVFEAASRRERRGRRGGLQLKERPQRLR